MPDHRPSPHPTVENLQAFALGKLREPISAAVAAHLTDCGDCRVKVSEVSSDSFLDRFRNAGSPVVATAAHAPRRRAATPPPESLPPGLADHPDYQIIRELGRGGMGVVYLAHNELMGRDEVLKVMGRHLAERPGVLDRFLREIRSVARLRHANIVTAYHAFRVGDSIAFAMEYVDGFDLSKLVKTKGPLPVGHAAYFIQQAALGLQHAHEEGMVHRDIKPGNLMLARKGERAVVKVLDFGLAKATSEQVVDGGLTQEGQMLGTPDYIAPEQTLDAQKCDIRADIYSLGCTLYYLLTGGPPFRGPSLYDLLQAHQSMDAKPLNLVRPDVPVELAALVAKMMAKDTFRRFQTPGDVARALTPFFKKGSATAPAAPSPRAVVAPAPPSPVAPVTFNQPIAAPVPAPAPESPWASLIEFKETERPTPAPALKPAPRPSLPPSSRRLMVAVAAALAGFVVVMAGVTLVLKYRGGEVEIKNLPDGAIVKVDGNDTEPGKEGEKRFVKIAHGRHDVSIGLDDETQKVHTVTVDWGTANPTTVTIKPASSAVAAVPKPAAPNLSVDSGTWTALFDGKIPRNWTAWDADDRDALKFWRIENGILVGSGPLSHLYSPRDDYRDVRVRAEIKINDGGNAGLIVRAKQDAPYPLCYEAQVNSTSPAPKTGSLFLSWTNAVPVDPSPVPPDTWFTLEIKAVGNHVQVFVDGKPYAEYTDPDGGRAAGHIALQVHDEQTRVEVRKLEVMELGEASAATAPTDATTYQGKRYKVFNDFVTWHEAKRLCESKGGRLTIVQSAEQNKVLTALVQNAGLHHAWLGATDVVTEGNWVWVDGTAMGFNAWDRASNQPNNSYEGIPEHYLCLLADRGGLWWDQPDGAQPGWRPGFICEWDDSTVASPASDETGFVPLFNGKNLNGWKPDRGDPANWRIEDGQIVAVGPNDYRKRSYLLSDRNLADFRLRFEFYLPGDSDSGFVFRAVPGEEPSPLEVNLRNIGGNAPTGSFHAVRRGDVHRPPDRPALLRGEPAWDEMEVEARGPVVRVWINGRQVQDLDLRRYATNSDALPGVSRPAGRIGFQSEEGNVRFRNIRVKELGSTGDSPTRKASTRPNDAVPFGDHFVKVFSQHLTWQEASRKCHAMGGRLAVVKDAEQNRIVTALLNNAGVENAWLGATDERNEGDWVWVDGSPMRYTNWAREGNQPNNGGGRGEHYLVILSRNNGTWCDQPADSVVEWPGFVCEWD